MNQFSTLIDGKYYKETIFFMILRNFTKYQQMVHSPQVKRDLTSGRKTLAYELSHKISELVMKSNQKIRKYWENLKFGQGHRLLSILSSKQSCLALVVKYYAKTDIKTFKSRPICLTLYFSKNILQNIVGEIGLMRQKLNENQKQRNQYA